MTNSVQIPDYPCRCCCRKRYSTARPALRRPSRLPRGMETSVTGFVRALVRGVVAIFTALEHVRIPPWKHKGLWWQR